MASLPTRTTASFDAIKPVSSLVLLDNEFNQYVGASGVFNGGTTATKLLVKTSDATDPPVDQDQIGAGLLARWKQNGTTKVSISNTGLFTMANTAVNTGFNADQVDGIEGANIAKLDTHKATFSVSWFYAVLPGAVETIPSAPRWIVPSGNTIQIIDLVVIWAGGTDSAASNIFTIKRRNSAGIPQADVGTVNVNTPNQDVIQVTTLGAPLTLSAGDQIYPLFTTRNTATEQVVTISARGTQLFTT
jgi:hypothetical protein